MTIYVLGQSGMLGRYTYDYFKYSHITIGINRNNNDDSFSYIGDSNFKNSKVLIRNLKENDIIINCFGLIPQRNQNKSKYEYIKVNTVLPHILQSECEKAKAKLIHVTTDCVFNGSKDFYHEYSNHDCVDVYGKTKSLGEPENATVIRTSLIGEEVHNKKSLLEFVKSNKNKEINGYINHYWNGITCLQFAKICDEIISKNLFWKGVKHIYSPDAINKFNLIRLISEIYNLNVKVRVHQTEKYCYRILISKRNDHSFTVPSIKQQIIEQKDFGENIFDN